jgi:hypothetical protein
MSGSYKGENEIHTYGLKMYEFMKREIKIDENDRFIDNFICYMLNRTEWLEMWRKRPVKKKDYSEEQGTTIYDTTSYIIQVRKTKDGSDFHTEIFVNHWWLKKCNRNKYNEFLKSICHELIHHFEYLISYYTKDTINLIELAQEEKALDKYVYGYKKEYPRDKKRFKKIMKQKKFILRPIPSYK